MKSEVSGVLVAAHDLKAPLTLLRQLALSLELAEDFEVRARLQSQIVSVSERAMRMVNDLAKTARLEDGLFEMEPVSVRGVCDEVYRELVPLFRYEGRCLALKYHNRNKLAVASRELLRSVIYNFCTNALHYSDPESKSELSVSEINGKIRIGVRDFGPALPARIWRELKAEGVRKPTAIAMRPGSSGLGLYVASEFARRMHSEVGAVRHRDGTSFFIDLPVSEQLCLF